MVFQNQRKIRATEIDDTYFAFIRGRIYKGEGHIYNIGLFIFKMSDMA